MSPLTDQSSEPALAPGMSPGGHEPRPLLGGHLDTELLPAVKPIALTSERVLLALAPLGFLVPNGVFVYCALCRYSVVSAAQGNPVSAAFIGEAIFFMLLLAWFFQHQERGPMKGWVFPLLTLVGRLAFSVPFSLILYGRNQRRLSAELAASPDQTRDPAA